jgi:hypothetical protein
MTDLTEFLAASKLEDLVSQLLPAKAGSKTSENQLSNHTVEILSQSVKEDIIRYFSFM